MGVMPQPLRLTAIIARFGFRNLLIATTLIVVVVGIAFWANSDHPRPTSDPGWTVYTPVLVFALPALIFIAVVVAYAFRK
jgi:ribose/xylose/arabinose/galactoside ABC-type transport system permease subunit